ncbi:hypothetical protein [Bizionia sp.]|uniref:hypothetical protein n=1 Tax=Bizionia sp. TaxID=1954480 RepID=UPI003A9539C5
MTYYYKFYALPNVFACLRKHNANITGHVTTEPFEHYVLYLKLTLALLAWGEGRFTIVDMQLIAKVSWKRYRQILKNLSPGIRSKWYLFFQVMSNSMRPGVQLVYFF